MYVETSNRKTLNNLCSCSCTCKDDIIKVIGSQFVAYSGGSPFGKLDICEFVKRIGVVSKDKIEIKPKDFVVLRLEDTITQFLLLKAYSTNKQFQWRFVSDGSIQDYVVNYGLSIDVTSTTVLDDRMNITGTYTLTPDPTVRNPTWNTLGTTFINGKYYTRWYGTNLTWFDAQRYRLTNSVTLPTITGTITGSLTQDINGVFTGQITFVAVKDQITITCNVGLSGTLPSTITISSFSAVMTGKYTATFDCLTTHDLAVVDNLVTGTITANLYTSKAKKYRRCDQNMLLTSYGDIGIEDIEIYNPFTDLLKLEFLSATMAPGPLDDDC